MSESDLAFSSSETESESETEPPKKRGRPSKLAFKREFVVLKHKSKSIPPRKAWEDLYTSGRVRKIDVFKN